MDLHKKPVFDADIIEEFAVLSEHGSVKKLFTLVSFGGNKPKFDIRLWKELEDTDRKRPFKGITLTTNELLTLKEALLSDKFDLTPEEEPQEQPKKMRINRRRTKQSIDKDFNPETVITEDDLLKILGE